MGFKVSANDNFLEIDLGERFGELLVYRFESWNDGLVCTIRDPEGTRIWGFEHDLPIKFSDVAYMQQSGAWLAGFPAGLPDRLIRFELTYPGLIYPVLLLLSKSAENLDLFNDFPLLFWAVIATARKANLNQQEITRLLGEPRVKLLGFCGLPENKATLKLMRKLVFRRMNAALWKEFTEFSQLARKHKELNHLPAITEGLMQFSHQFPDLIQARFFAHSDQTTNWSEYMGIISEIYRLADLLEFPVDRQRMIRARNQKELTRYHDSLTQRFHEQSFSDEVQTFPAPLIPGNEEIQPILDSYELSLEGRTMNHCVYSYSQEVIAGNCSIYRVMGPERATLRVNCSPEGAHYLAELKLRSNKPPAKPTVAFINQWIERSLNGVTAAEKLADPELAVRQ